MGSLSQAGAAGRSRKKKKGAFFVTFVWWHVRGTSRRDEYPNWMFGWPENVRF